MLKSSLLFKKNAIFSGKQLESFQDHEYEIFRILFLFEQEHLVRSSSLHQCTFKFDEAVRKGVKMKAEMKVKLYEKLNMLITSKKESNFYLSKEKYDMLIQQINTLK